MKEKDKLQLIDPSIIKHIAELDAQGLWQLMLERLDDLKRLEQFESPALNGLPHGMEHFEKVFWMFYDEDADDVRWSLAYDLGFIGKPLRIDPWAASGYFDSALSTNVITSRELITLWDDESENEHYVSVFDVLDADHLDLIAASLGRFRNLGLEDDPTARLQVDTMAKAIRNDPTLRAAYIYQT